MSHVDGKGRRVGNCGHYLRETGPRSCVCDECDKAENDRLRAEVAELKSENIKLETRAQDAENDSHNARAEVAELREALDRTCTRFERAMRHSGSAEWAIIEATKQDRAILAKTQPKNET